MTIKRGKKAKELKRSTSLIISKRDRGSLYTLKKTRNVKVTKRYIVVVYVYMVFVRRSYKTVIVLTLQTVYHVWVFCGDPNYLYSHNNIFIFYRI